MVTLLKVGGGVVGIFNAQVDDVSEFLVQKDMGKSKEDSSDLSAALLTYVQVAYELRNRGFRFGLSTSEELVERLGDKAYTIYVYKPPKYLSEHFGEQAVDHYYEVNPALEGLREFVLEHSMPLIGRVMEDNEMQYVSQDLPVFLLFLDGQDLLNHKLLSFYRVVAAKYTAVARFAVVDKMEAHMVLRYFRTDLLGFDEEDVLEDNFKAFACFSSKSKKAYRLGAADFSTRSIESFIRRIVYGDKDSAFAYEVSSKLDTKEDL